jgi:UDP-GlcNAc:undecaprenyl-phosphate GlcNAc-1-phosphate transferase
VIVVQLTAFLVFGLYRGLWRYTSLADLPVQLRAVVAAWLSTVVVLGFAWRFDAFSRGALVIDALLLAVLVAGTRISFRLIRAWLQRHTGPGDGRRVLIYGAGDGGELLLRELQNNRELGLHAVGFVDDDATKRGRVIHGVRVLGPAEELTAMVGAQQIDELVISTHKLPEERASLIVQLCGDAGIRVRRLRIALD